MIAVRAIVRAKKNKIIFITNTFQIFQICTQTNQLRKEEKKIPHDSVFTNTQEE